MEPTLHFISHTHWDREWHLTFQVFRLRLVRLIDDLLDLFENDPDYRHYMLDGQTIVLDDYLQVRPERAEELRRYIAEGRLSIGPWYILPDEFLVSPESTVRNLLQGDRTARLFGGKMQIGYIPDPFGHLGQMPQILAGFGIRHASVQRGLDDEPAEFWWQSPDGTRVLMGYMRDGYGNACGLPADQPETFVSEVCRRIESLAPHSATGQLVMMHGIDHMLPVPATSRALEYTRQQLPGVTVKHSSLPEVFADIEAQIERRKLDLPVVTGELRSSKRHPLLPAVLSTRVWIKQRNHACEIALEKWAEPFSTLADLLTPGEYIQRLPRHNAAVLRQAWRQLMECHPHDSICGCSVDQVHAEMRPRFDQAEQVAEEVTRHSLDHIAAQIDTCPPDSLTGWCSPYQAVIAFNPSDAPVTGIVDAVVDGLGDFQVLDAAGKAMPTLVLEATPTTIAELALDRYGLFKLLGEADRGQVSGLAYHKFNIQDVQLERENGHLRIDVGMAHKVAPNLAQLERAMPQLQSELGDEKLNNFTVKAFTRTTKVRFLAEAVPPHGYRTFWVCPAAAQSPAEPEWQSVTDAAIENEFFSVSASLDDGTLSLTDHRTGQVYSGLNRFEDGGDGGDEYNFNPPAHDRLLTGRLVAVRRRISALEQSIQIDQVIDTPLSLTPDRQSRSLETVPLKITTTARLTPGVAALEIRTDVDNPAHDHRLRVHFPAPFSVDAAAYDGHYEIVERPLDLPAYDNAWIEAPRPEVPQRCFTAIQDPASGNGLVIANRGLREAAALRTESGTEIAITLLRCIDWLSRGDLSTRKGDAGPRLLTPEAQMEGKWSFEYAVIPHIAGKTAEAYQTAYAFNAMPRAVVSALHAGSLPAAGSFVRSSKPEFVITALKQTEDEQGWIVRGYSIAGQPLQVALKFWRSFADVQRCNLAEESLEPLALSPQNELALAVKPYEIVTIRLS